MTDAVDPGNEAEEKAACYAVVMQLAATRKVAGAVTVLLVLGAAVWWHTGSLWWFVGTVVLSFLAFHFIMQSCVRVVKRETGMPEAVQVHFSNLYKTDTAFKGRVDAFDRDARGR